jgi:hypothetical protein
VESTSQSINRRRWKNAVDVFPYLMTIKLIVAMIAVVLAAPVHAEDELKLADLAPAVRRRLKLIRIWEPRGESSCIS